MTLYVLWKDKNVKDFGVESLKFLPDHCEFQGKRLDLQNVKYREKDHVIVLPTLDNELIFRCGVWWNGGVDFKYTRVLCAIFIYLSQGEFSCAKTLLGVLKKLRWMRFFAALAWVVVGVVGTYLMIPWVLYSQFLLLWLSLFFFSTLAPIVTYQIYEEKTLTRVVRKLHKQPT